jgi:hypothetical protein
MGEVILATSLAPEARPTADVLALCRLRWRIDPRVKPGTYPGVARNDEGRRFDRTPHQRSDFSVAAFDAPPPCAEAAMRRLYFP